MTMPTYTAESDPAVRAERARQIEDLGYTPEHDDAHSLRELAACADDRLALLIDANVEGPPTLSRRLTEVRAVMLAVIESAERRIAAARLETSVETLPVTQRARIVSDGTPLGTYVLVDGRRLSGVTEVTWRATGKALATATLTVQRVDVDVETDAEIRPEDP